MLADIDEDALAASVIDTDVLDVCDAAACEQAVAEVVERHGRLDAVWANAGIASFGPLALTDPEAWERTIEINLLGVFRTVRAALPAITASGGYVAVTASLASFAQAPGLSAYSGVEGRRRGDVQLPADRSSPTTASTSATIHPTWIDTDMVREARSRARWPTSRLREAMRPPFRKTYPVERAAKRHRRRVRPPGAPHLHAAVRADWPTCCARRRPRGCSSATCCAAAPEIERLFEAQAAERGRVATPSVDWAEPRQLRGTVRPYRRWRARARWAPGSPRSRSRRACRTLLYDPDPEALERAPHGATPVRDLARLAECGLVIEAAPEDLELKRDAVRAAGRGRPARVRAGDQHLVAERDRAGGRGAEPGARRRHALLQPAGEDAARRGRRRRRFRPRRAGASRARRARRWAST